MADGINYPKLNQLRITSLVTEEYSHVGRRFQDTFLIKDASFPEGHLEPEIKTHGGLTHTIYFVQEIIFQERNTYIIIPTNPYDGITVIHNALKSESDRGVMHPK